MNIRFYFIYLTVFVNVMAFTLIFPLLPTYAQRFDASTLQIGMLAGSFGLAQLFCSPLWGRVSDRIGRKPTIMIGVSGLGLGFLVLAVSQSLWMLFVGRLLQGVFSGASLPSARAYAADMSDKTNRVKSMGRIEASLALGTILGPFIGGVLAESSFVIPLINFSVEQSITTPFFFSFLFAMVNFLLVLLFLPESLSKKAENIAWKEGFVHFTKMRTFFAGPLAPLLILAFVWSFGLSNNQVNIPLFSESILGVSAGGLGVLFAVMGTISLVTQLVFLSSITRFFGERRTVIFGLSCMMVAIGSMPFVPSFHILMVSAALSAFGSAISRPVLSALASEETTEGQGTTMGMMTALEAFGRMVGPFFAGALFGITFFAPFLFSATVIGISLVVAVVWFDFFKRNHRHSIA